MALHDDEPKAGESAGSAGTAAQDARDIAEAEAIRARPGPRTPHDVIVAMMDADDDVHDALAAALDSRATEDVPPDAVRDMWEAVKTNSRP
jgi:hypothetical protein